MELGKGDCRIEKNPQFQTIDSGSKIRISAITMFWTE